MSAAQSYIRAVYGASFTKQSVRNRVLSSVEASSLRLALVEDAKTHYHAALVSVIDAIRGLCGGFYTWSTIKLYYAAVYALRAMLESTGHSLFYVASSPFYIEARQGATAAARSGTTHAAIQSLFKASMSTHFILSQSIALDAPLKWLTDRREEANYTGQFSEPTPPDHFRVVERAGVRTLVNAYLEKPQGTYAFDPDHAMLAFPLTAIIFAKGQLVEPLDDSQKSFLRANCRDSKGKLPGFIKAFDL